MKLTVGKLTEEQIQAALQVPIVTYVKGPGVEIRYSGPPRGPWRVSWYRSSSPPMERGHFLSGFLLSLPVIRWFAPKCGARISEGQHVSPREGQDVSLREALGDPRCAKPRWHRGAHVWLNPR